MVELPAGFLVKLGAALGRAENVGVKELRELQEVFLEEGASDSESIIEEEKKDWIEELGLRGAVDGAFSRIKKLVKEGERALREDEDGDGFMEDLGRWCWAFAVRLEEGLGERVVLALERDRERYYEGAGVWGEAVGRFEEAEWDMREAGKCYAFERYTASIFHVMRVLEHGLKAVAGTIPSFEREGSLDVAWGRILRAMDREISKEPSVEKEVWFKGKEKFYSSASSFMWAVKLAWRDGTMHAEGKFEEREAKRIQEASGNLMIYIAEHV